MIPMREMKEQRQVFFCGECGQEPIEPIVTECGHLFCWSCICRQDQAVFPCPVCTIQVTNSNSYPLFVQHREDTKTQQNSQIRPSAMYRNKIINPGIGSSTMPTGMTNLPNNIAAGKRIPGVSYLPSMAVNVFNRIKEPNSNSADYHAFKCYQNVGYVLMALLLITVAIILIY